VSIVKLTLKQKAFADYYIELGNATEAARRAGYSKKTAGVIGDENLKKPYIQNYIGERLKEIESERIADAAEVLKYLTKVLRGETESEIVIVEGTGEGCSQARHVIKAPDEREKLKAAELLGKRYGLYIDKVDVSEPINITIKRKGD
jgi:phage terminase small subunit